MEEPEKQRNHLYAYLDDLNSIIHEVVMSETSNGPADLDVMEASLPTIDNNIWSSLPQLSNIVLGKLQTKNLMFFMTKPVVSWTLQIKRSLLGVFVELLVFCLLRTKPNFSVLSSDTNSPDQKKLAIFTYGDFETREFSRGGDSRYWGELPTWKNGIGATWISFEGGIKGGAKLTLAKNASGPLRNYLSSLGSRRRIWIRLKKRFSKDLKFRQIGKEIRRGLLGQPALEASYLSIKIDQILDSIEGQIVLTPHENQMWERLLFAACKKRNLIGVGVLHSTPRFWDTRFMYFAAFEQFAPSVIVSNSPVVPLWLSQAGYKLENIASAPSLRFQHLLNPEGSPDQHLTASIQRIRVLVTLGDNKAQSAELINLVLQGLSPRLYEISFRPHPVAERRLSGLLRGLNVEKEDFAQLIDNYQLFVCDLHSSMALEFLAFGKKTLVHLPKNCVNLSPLYGLSGYNAFFSDLNELRNLVSEPTQDIDLDQILTLRSAETNWSLLLETLIGKTRT